MTNLEIQKYIEDNLRNCQGGEMMDEQIFYEGAKWYRDYVVNKLPIHNVSKSLPIKKDCNCGNNFNPYKDGNPCWDCDSGNVY